MDDEIRREVARRVERVRQMGRDEMDDVGAHVGEIASQYRHHVMTGQLPDDERFCRLMLYTMPWAWGDVAEEALHYTHWEHVIPCFPCYATTLFGEWMHLDPAHYIPPRPQAVGQPAPEQDQESEGSNVIGIEDEEEPFEKPAEEVQGGEPEPVEEGHDNGNDRSSSGSIEMWVVEPEVIDLVSDSD